MPVSKDLKQIVSDLSRVVEKAAGTAQAGKSGQALEFASEQEYTSFVEKVAQTMSGWGDTPKGDATA